MGRIIFILKGIFILNNVSKNRKKRPPDSSFVSWNKKEEIIP